MSATINDPGVRNAAAREIGHGAPFAEAELRTLSKLSISGASDLSELELCSGLSHLEIAASDVRDLDALKGLERLSVLHVIACPLEELTALEGLPGLVDVQVDFTWVQDLEPLTRLPKLARGRVIGNPVSAESWAQARPALQRKALIEFPRHEHWVTSCLLWENGFRECFAAVDELRPVFVRPGVCGVANLLIDAVITSDARLRLAIDLEEDPSGLFDELVAYSDGVGESRPTDFTSHREFGWARDARRWIEAAPPSEQAWLRRFVWRFSDSMFYRESEQVFAAVAETAGVTYPDAIAASRSVLAGVVPGDDARFKLVAFGDKLPISDQSEEIWYTPTIGIYATTEQAELFRDELRMFPIAKWIETLDSILAASLVAGDPAIYEFGDEDVDVARVEGRNPRSSVYRAFSSHAELLAHIAAFKLPGGTVIEAKPDASGDED